MIVNTGRARPQADGTYVVPVLNARAEMRGCKVFVQTPDDRTVLVRLIAPVEGTETTPYTDWTARTTTIEEPSPMTEPEIITWTATRRLEEGDDQTFARLVAATHPDAKHITGGCIGGDAVLARLLYGLGRMVHVVLPFDRSKVDPEWQLYCTSFEEMPEGTTYRQRDERMVELGTRCIGICNRPEKHGAFHLQWRVDDGADRERARPANRDDRASAMRQTHESRGRTPRLRFQDWRKPLNTCILAHQCLICLV